MISMAIAIVSMHSIRTKMTKDILDFVLLFLQIDTYLDTSFVFPTLTSSKNTPADQYHVERQKKKTICGHPSWSNPVSLINLLTQHNSQPSGFQFCLSEGAFLRDVYYCSSYQYLQELRSQVFNCILFLLTDAFLEFSLVNFCNCFLSFLILQIAFNQLEKK